MFVLGHVGIGRRLAALVDDRLPVAALVVGTLLPDLIDKPLYYSRMWSYISCTRTFGHTGLLLVAIVAIAYWRRSRALKALALGVATHLFLDFMGDSVDAWQNSSTAVALSWPVASTHFTDSYIPSLRDHALALLNWPTVVGEVVGLGFLARGWWTHHRTPSSGEGRPETAAL